jgi:DNA-binding transcriptional LysR family regulator
LKYPNVELDLVSDGRLVDIVATSFDAGVRLAEDVPQDMIAVKFSSDVRFVTVASPAYLKHRTIPATPDDLRQHQCIRQRLPSGKRYRWEFSKRGEEMIIDAPGALTLGVQSRQSPCAFCIASVYRRVEGGRAQSVSERSRCSYVEGSMKTRQRGGNRGSRTRVAPMRERRKLSSVA